MTVSKLEPDPRKKGRWLLTLENDDSLVVTDAEMADFALYAGMELDQKTRAALKKAASARLARERAMELISARPMSRAELLQKLGAKGGKASDHEAAADFLERAGLLNDAEYAQRVCAHYAAKGYGIYKIRDELYRRRVPREFWEDALANLPAPGEFIASFLARRLGEAAGRKELKKCADALARRGFSYDDIRDGLERYENQREED